MTSPLDIEQAVAQVGLNPLRAGEADLFSRYLELLLRWNARLNLTAVRDPHQIVTRHFVECIQCAQALPKIQTLLDFGSGAGLPGIPISILRPEINVVLGESHGKKSSFLREAVRTLGLNAQIFDGRIEAMSPERTFDAVTLRAVDRMEEAARLGLDRVRPGGVLVLFATAGTESALKVSLPGLEWEAQFPLHSLETGILLFGRKPCST